MSKPPAARHGESATDRPHTALSIATPKQRHHHFLHTLGENAIAVAKGALVMLLLHMLVLQGRDPFGCKISFLLDHYPVFSQFAIFLVIYIVFVITGIEQGHLAPGKQGPGPTPVTTFLGALAVFLLFNALLSAGAGVWAVTWPAPYTWLAVALVPLVLSMVITELRSDIQRRENARPTAVGALGGRKGSRITHRRHSGLARFDPLLKLVQAASIAAFFAALGIGFFKGMAHRKKRLGKGWSLFNFLFGIRYGRGDCTSSSFRRYSRTLARKRT